LGGKASIREEKEREMRNEPIILHTKWYKPISPTIDQYRSMVTFQQIRCTGKLHLPALVARSYSYAIYTRPKSKEEMKRREAKQEYK
jgi:hypothetical protein